MQEIPSDFEANALVWLPQIFRSALRISGNPTDAEDLTQETFLRAYRSWKRGSRVANPKAWLFTILMNLRRDRYQKATREPMDLVWGEEADLQAPPINPENGELAEEVERALAALPIRYRTAVVLSDLEGLSYQEICEASRSPMGTVKARILRGRRLLGRFLQDYATRQGFLPLEREAAEGTAG